MASPREPVEKVPGSADLILNLYATLLQDTWDIVSELIGEAIFALLLATSLEKVSKKYPFLNHLKVSEEGISWKELRGQSRSLSPSEMHRGFQSLINHLFYLFSTMAEGVISRELFPKVFPKIREAERLLSQKQG
jgi:hypothetical protein